MIHLRTLTRWALLALLLSQLACSWDYAAIDKFTAEQTCPAERLAVKALDGVKPADIVDLRQPPSNVAADPQRLALWNQQNQSGLAVYQDLSLVDIAGCGVHRTYFCWFEDDGNNSYGAVSFPVDLDRDDAHLGPYLLKPDARQTLLLRLQSTKAKAP